MRRMIGRAASAIATALVAAVAGCDANFGEYECGERTSAFIRTDYVGEGEPVRTCEDVCRPFRGVLVACAALGEEDGWADGAGGDAGTDAGTDSSADAGARRPSRRRPLRYYCELDDAPGACQR